MVDVCDFCDNEINQEYGFATCSCCEEEKCVEFCIPGGTGTYCATCEESEEYDDNGDDFYGSDEPDFPLL